MLRCTAMSLTSAFSRHSRSVRAAAVGRWRRGAPPVLLCALPTLTGGVTAQQLPPSNEKLRSMYCVEMLRAEIDLQRHMISASVDAAERASTPAERQQWLDTSAELIQGLAKLEGVMYRFQVHMLPRIQSLDSYALARAIRQGATDSQAVASVGDCENPTWLAALRAPGG